MIVLGVNAVFHDPAAALVVDGEIVAAAEEERFSRRKHGKPPVAFSTWELPEQSMAWCLEAAGIGPADLDAVAYSYDPAIAVQPDGDITAADWEGLRTLYARRAPLFLQTALPGLDPEQRPLRPAPRRARRLGDVRLRLRPLLGARARRPRRDRLAPGRPLRRRRARRARRAAPAALAGPRSTRS